MKWLPLLIPLTLASSCTDLLELPTQQEAIGQLGSIKPAEILESCILSGIEKYWWDFAGDLTAMAVENKVKLSE
jgi:hypothetical protein